MKIVNIQDLTNPRDFRIVPCLDYPGLWEIKDKDNKSMDKIRYTSKMRAEERLAGKLSRVKSKSK